MLQKTAFPLFLPLASLLFPLLALENSTAQSSPDGYTLQERPGIALVKPQPWSKDKEATVLEFEAFTDRTAKGAPGAGYYEFQGKTSKRQVAAAKVVKLVVYPDPAQIKEMVKPEDKQTVMTTVDEIQEVIVRFPSTRTYLSPSLKKLQAEVTQYDSGKVKTGGTWITKQAYLADRAGKFAKQLKADVVQADPPSSLDLENDPKYLALKEMASGNPAVQTIITEITDLHTKLVRGEKRKDLLTKLSDSTTGTSEAESLVGQLRSLKPEEDARSVAYLKAWDEGSATVKKTSDEAAKLAAALEAELASYQAEDVPPALSQDLDKQISTLNGTMQIFLATSPPSQLVTQARQALAVCEANADFKKLHSLFEEKHFIDAKDTGDSLARQAAHIGPETARVAAGLQRFTAGKIEEFSRLRQEAKLLVDSGKPGEALTKYEAAFAVIPDGNVGEQIEQLKKSAPPAQ